MKASHYLKFIKGTAVACLIAAFTACGNNPPEAERRADAELNGFAYDPSKPDYTLPDGIQKDDLNFLKTQAAYAGLSRKVHQATMRVCYYDTSNSTRRKEVLKTSILKWVAALSDVAKKPLTNSVEIVGWGSAGCDLQFVVGNYSVAHAQMGVLPRVNVAPSGWYGSDTVILHELGHAFGLLDTYSGRGGACQAGQPSSVMCYASFMELKPDDIAGMKSLYRDIFPNL